MEKMQAKSCHTCCINAHAKQSDVKIDQHLKKVTASSGAKCLMASPMGRTFIYILYRVWQHCGREGAFHTWCQRLSGGTASHEIA
jgi:hypothetical protein